MGQAEPRASLLRPGLRFRPLSGGQVFVTHPEIASQILDQRVATALQLCQGQPIAATLPEVRAVLDYDCTAEEWQDYLARLARDGLFEGQANRSPRVRLFDPGPAMDLLAGKCRWLFTAPAVGILFLLLFAGLWRLLAHWDLFAAQVTHYTGVHPFLSVLLFYFCFLPVGLLHELAHGVVCRWFGGEVLEVGLQRDSANLYVLSNKVPLNHPRARILYYAGGAFLDMAVFFLLVNLWLAWPNYLAFMFLLPQALFFLQFSYAMERGSDLSRIVSEWTKLPQAEGRWAFVEEFFSSPPKTPAQRKRAAVYLGSILLQLAVAVLLIGSFRQPTNVSLWPGRQASVPFWPPLLYLIYRLLRHVLMNYSRWLRPAR
jgi:hypothetical protein